MSYTLQTTTIATGKPAKDLSRHASISHAKHTVRGMLQTGYRYFDAEVIRETDGEVVAYYNGDTWADADDPADQAAAEEHARGHACIPPAPSDIVRLDLTRDEISTLIKAANLARRKAHARAGLHDGRAARERHLDEAGELDILVDKLISYHGSGE